MLKTILVPATGHALDAAVFDTALAVARQFAAHLEFLHVRLDALDIAAGVAAAETGGDFVSGDLIERWDQDAGRLEEEAFARFQDLCARERIPIVAVPPGPAGVSAQWRREFGQEPDWVVRYGQQSDLLVVGRPGVGATPAMPSDTLEAALIETGRPLLLPAATTSRTRAETVAIAWKATPEAARAVAASMPFLERARRIVVLTVEEDERRGAGSAARLIEKLQWHGLDARSRPLRKQGRDGAEELLAAAEEEHAGLLVMGGYGHGRLREMIFGGFTARVLHDGTLPVLMMH